MAEINDAFANSGDSIMDLCHIKATKIYNEEEFPVVNKDLMGRPPLDGIWRGDYVGELTEKEIEKQIENNNYISDNILETPEMTITEGTISEVNIPAEIAKTVKITGEFVSDSVVKSEGNKLVYVTNTSENPVSMTLDAPGVSTVYLTGKFSTIKTNTSINLKSGEINDVVLADELSKNVTINAALSTGTVISSPKSNKEISIINSNPVANITVIAPNAKVTLNGKEYSTITSTTGENTLIVGFNTNIGLLKVVKGNVIVNDITIDGHFGKIENDTNYTITPRTVSVPSEVTNLTSTPGIFNITEDCTITNGAVFGIVASGNYKYNNSAHVITGNKNGICITRSGVNIYFDGDGTWENPNGYGIWKSSNTGEMKIYGGHFIAETHAVYAEKGFIEIYGGEFEVTDEDKKFTLNCLDTNYTAGTAGITVYGGKFHGFNPAESMSEPDGPISFVAEGYKSVEIEEGIWEVVKA